MESQRKLMDFFFITNKEATTHYHQNVEIIYLVSGRMDIRIGDDVYELKNDDFVLINANKNHSVMAKSEVFGVRFVVDYHLLSEYMGTVQMLFWCNTVLDRNDAYEDLRRLMGRIMERHFERDEKGSLYLNSLYYEFVYLLVSNFMVKADDARLKLGNSKDRLRLMQIQNYIQANYQKQISLYDLAEKMYLSHTYLSKYIKKHLGLTFMEYLNNIRLFHAVDELLYSGKSLTHIALDNGFPSSAAFTKAFRETHNESPNAYRKRMKEESDRNREEKEDEAVSNQIIHDYLKRKQERQQGEPDADKTLCAADAACAGDNAFHPCRAVNIGEASLILESEVQEQILLLKKEAGIRYVRFWNLFDPDRNPQGETASASYNFRMLDRVLDFLTGNGIKPYIELGNKPRNLFHSPDAMLYEDHRPPEVFSISAFERLIQAFSVHLMNRYGIGEIESWYFEFWNNPLLRMDQEDGAWYRYFSSVQKAFHSLSPDIPVGGAGLILGVDTKKNQEILRVWKKKDCPPDFISVYAYQYIAMYEDGRPYGRKSLDSSYITNQITIFRKILEEEGFSGQSLHLTEWNFTISNRNIINDSCEQGSYILKNCLDLNGTVDMSVYWHGLDLYSEHADSTAVLNGDSGLLSRDGARKPGFYAFFMLNKMHRSIIGKYDFGMVTSDRRDGYAIACHNFKKLSLNYVMTEESQIRLENLDNYFEDALPRQMHFRIRNVRNGKYLVKSYFINTEYGSALDIWRRMEYLPVLGAGDVDYLKRSCMPCVAIKLVEVQDGLLDIECRLLPQEIRLFEIAYFYEHK